MYPFKLRFSQIYKIFRDLVVYPSAYRLIKSGGMQSCAQLMVSQNCYFHSNQKFSWFCNKNQTYLTFVKRKLI